MIHEIDKLTPIIKKLGQYEEIAQEFERKDVPISIGGDVGITGYKLDPLLREKAQKAIHSIIATEVKKLQKELAKALRGLECLEQ